MDSSGAIRSGQLSASDEGDAARELLRQGLTPIELKDMAASLARSATTRRAITAGERLSLLQELATLLGAGVSLAEVLPSLAMGHGGRALGQMLLKVSADVSAGKSLSLALRDSALQLPSYVLALIEAGEASGELATALTDAAAQMDHERQMSQELRNALVYPAVLVFAGIVAILIIFIGVVPRFASLLNSSRAEIPALSRWIIEAGLYLKQHLFEFGLGSSGLVLAGVLLLGQADFRQRVLEFAAKLPMLGTWLLRVEIGRWATVMGVLLTNRVSIVTALELSAGTLQLPSMRHEMHAAKRELERGRALSDILSQRAWFPAVRLNLLRVGERSGELPRMLRTLGAIETETARVLQRRVLTLIEPAAILGIGAVIGVIMVAVMMAITSLNTAAG